MKKNKVILIIDDDLDMCHYLRKLLEGMGHEVHDAQDSDSAKEKINEIVPHLILLDINLDQESGFTLLGEIKKLDPYSRIKTIMISSLSSKKAIDMSKKVGADGYLVKPINNNILMTTLRKMLPEIGFPTAKDLDDKFSMLSAKCLGQVVKISEVECVLRSKVKFRYKHKVDINSEFFNKKNLTNIQFIINDESTDVSPGTYDTKVQMIGLSDSDHQVIRKLNTKKA